MGLANRTFEEWMQKVDAYLATNTYVTSTADLPDCDYYTWYENGWTPARAALRAINEAGGY